MNEEAPDDDTRLMLLARDGDLAAFEEIVRRHQYAIVGTAARMLGCQADGEDIAQAAFVRAWKSAPRYRPKAKVSTWLLTITRNLVFNELRRRKRAILIPLDPPDDDSPHHQVADESQRTADRLAGESELSAAIDAALAALPEKPRLALILRRYENLPYEDIATTLGMSVSAVKSLLFRARNDLRQSLAEHLENEGGKGVR